MKTSPADLKVELGFLRDNIVQAVREEKMSLVNEGLETYAELVSAFIQRMKQWGSKYDKRRAMQELSSITGDWSEVQWITDGLRELIDASMKQGSRQLLKDVVFFPMRLACIAFSNRDYYTFYRFISWMPYSYEASLHIGDKPVRDSVVDRCWRYLKETADLIIVPDLERSESEEDVDEAKDFALGIVITFNQLLYRAYARKEHEDFKLFVRALTTTFEYFRVDQFGVGLSNLIAPRKETVGGDGSVQDKDFRIPRKLALVRSELEQGKALAFYGLSGWILYQYDVGKLPAERFTEWFGSIPCSPDLLENWRLFGLTEDDRIRSDFGWDWWGFDGDAGSTITEAWGGPGFGFHLLFIVKALEALENPTAKQSTELTIPPSQELSALAGKGGYLLQLLDNIEREPKKWTPILGERAMAAAPRLREILSRSVKTHKREEASQLIREEISAGRVGGLADSIEQAWRENATLRGIVGRHGKYESGLTAPKEMPFFGINVRDRKEIYIKGSNLPVAEWGKQYGDMIARGEDETVLKIMVASVGGAEDLPAVDKETVTRIDGAIEHLRQSGYSPAVVVVVNSWRAARILEESKEFRASASAEPMKPLLGYYKGLAVYRVHVQGPSTVLVLDLKGFGRWVQFEPAATSEDARVIAGTLTLVVRPITKEQALTLIDKNPKLRVDELGDEKPLEDVLLEIQQGVHLSLTERFEYRVEDREAAFLLRSSEPF